MPPESSSWSAASETERDLLARVLGSELMANTQKIAAWTRLSGSAEESEAAEFVRKKLSDYGVRAEIITHDALISLPVKASLALVSPSRPAPEFVCITHSFGVATPPGGLTGQLVYVGRGRREDYDDLDVQGKIVLIEGLAGPETARIAGQHGAVAHININDDNLHEMIISPVWGSPETDDVSRLPRTAAVSVRQTAGEVLKDLLREGPVTVRVHTEVDTGWRKIPLVIGLIPGRSAGKTYVLLSGHLDSWHKGAMDNGSANATMLEVARILGRNAHLLRRGLKIAFWSGHSHGRYAGSAWYADQHWLDLYQNCVAHVNVDSTGGKGATVLGEANVMAEAGDLAGGCIAAAAPGERFTGTRFGRAGDQSFWGIGIPSMYMSLSQQPADNSKTAESFRSIIGGVGRRAGGLGWWWHTVHDTLDKIDEANLIRDTKVYLLTVLRLCAAPVLPFDYRKVCDELRDALRDLGRQGAWKLDLGPLQQELDGLCMALERAALALARLAWQADAGQEPKPPDTLDRDIEQANQMLMVLGRKLIPVNYTAGSPFRQDPALPVGPLPGLAGMTNLTSLDPGSAVYNMARVRFTRECNRVTHALVQARLLVEHWLSRGCVYGR
jgi:hypothetical protein